mgnify:CR=1 FL=1
MNRGFTLVEVIVAAAVLAVVGSLLFSILVNSTGFFYQQSSRSQQGLGINDSLVNIKGSIKEADSVSLNYPPKLSLRPLFFSLFFLPFQNRLPRFHQCLLSNQALVLSF